MQIRGYKVQLDGKISVFQRQPAHKKPDNPRGYLAEIFVTKNESF